MSHSSVFPYIHFWICSLYVPPEKKIVIIYFRSFVSHTLIYGNHGDYNKIKTNINVSWRICYNIDEEFQYKLYQLLHADAFYMEIMGLCI